MAPYDLLVVGAGISGLYAVREVLKKHPKWSVALAERYPVLGGRTNTFFHGDIHWEEGAGRIHKSHVFCMKLLKEYGLTWIPISPDITFKENGSEPSIDNPFEDLSKTYIQPLEHLSASILATHTIEQLLTRVHGRSKATEILSYFPYRAEVTTLRADLALKSFFGGEMGSHTGYGIVKEGFSELVERMATDIKKRGCTILANHKLIDVKDNAGIFLVDGALTLLEAKNTLLALHSKAVSNLPSFSDWKVLKHLQMKPLLRVYAIFDTPWFAEIKRVVTPERPRYIIPMNPEKGTIMISYTDDDDTAEYVCALKKSEKTLQKLVMKDVRSLFPELTIPEPTFFKSHSWSTGATYWLPGLYSPETLSKESIRPLPSMPHVFVCGESWSMKQAWVEGALEHTIQCLGQLERHHDV